MTSLVLSYEERTITYLLDAWGASRAHTYTRARNIIFLLLFGLLFFFVGGRPIFHLFELFCTKMAHRVWYHMIAHFVQPVLQVVLWRVQDGRWCFIVWAPFAPFLVILGEAPPHWLNLLGGGSYWFFLMKRHLQLKTSKTSSANRKAKPITLNCTSTIRPNSSRNTKTHRTSEQN